MATFSHKLLGERIADSRRIANVSQQQLAEDLSLPVDQLHNIESGNREPTIKQLANIAESLHLPLSYLLDGALNKGCPLFHPNLRAVEITFLVDLLPKSAQEAFLSLLTEITRPHLRAAAIPQIQQAKLTLRLRRVIDVKDNTQTQSPHCTRRLQSAGGRTPKVVDVSLESVQVFCRGIERQIQKMMNKQKQQLRPTTSTSMMNSQAVDFVREAA